MAASNYDTTMNIATTAQRRGDVVRQEWVVKDTLGKKGDLLVGTGNSTVVNNLAVADVSVLDVGNNGFPLVSNSASSLGVSYSRINVMTATIPPTPASSSVGDAIPLCTVDEGSGIHSWGARAITTNGMTNAAVTTDKIANVAVTTDKIADGAVTHMKIADGAVTESAIAAGAVTESAMAAGAINESAIADGAVSYSKLDSGMIAPPAQWIAIRNSTYLYHALSWTDGVGVLSVDGNPINPFVRGTSGFGVVGISFSNGSFGQDLGLHLLDGVYDPVLNSKTAIPCVFQNFDDYILIKCTQTGNAIGTPTVFNITLWHGTAQYTSLPAGIGVTFYVGY